MAEVSGKGGSVTCSGLTAGVKSWTLDYVSDPLDVTDFGDSGNRNFIAGLKSWSGTIEANWDAANTLAVGSTVTITLAVNSTTNYSGSAIITGRPINTAVDAVVGATYNFQGSGALS